jgi:predicted nucleic acid-binding protein
VSRALWDGQAAVLADTSAWITSRRIPAARKLLLDAVEQGDVAWCWPVRYELMIDARDREAIAALDHLFESLRQIAVDGAVQRGVLSLMRELAAGGGPRVPVAAQRSGLDILHHDQHFERLADSLGVRAFWLGEPIN